MCRSKCYSDLSKCVAVGGSRVLTVEEGKYKYGMGGRQERTPIGMDWNWSLLDS